MRRVTALVTVAGLVVVGAVRAAPAADGQAWIDAPLSGTVVGPAAVEVVAHATDPDGVAEVRLDVDGVTVASVVPPDAGEPLVTASLAWTPAEPGLHRLEVFGRDRSGEWGSPGRVRVSVDLGDGSTTTTSVATTTVTTTLVPDPTTTLPTRPGTTMPTTTAPPVTTSTVPRTTVPPATTVCAVGEPTPSGAAGTDTLTPRLSWTYAGCREPAQFDVQVSRDAGFARVETSGSVGGGSRTWTSDPLSDCTSYFWRVRADDGGSPGPWSSAASFTVQTVRSCG